MSKRLDLSNLTLINLDVDWSDMLGDGEQYTYITLAGSTINSLRGCPNCHELVLINCPNLTTLEHCPKTLILHIDAHLINELRHVPNIGSCAVFINGVQCMIDVNAVRNQRDVMLQAKTEHAAIFIQCMWRYRYWMKPVMFNDKRVTRSWIRDVYGLSAGYIGMMF